MIPLNLRIKEQLKAEIGKAADNANISMNEWAAKQLAKAFKGGEELGKVERKRPGRKRNEVAE